MEKKIKMLFKPLQLGPLTLKNRMIMSPMYTSLATVNGEVTQQLIDHYVARAKGQPGLIVHELTAVDGRHVMKGPQLRIDDDRFAPGLAKLVEAIHLRDVPVFIQIHHPGMFGTDPVAPSDVACYGFGRIKEYIQPRPMTIKEIEETRDLFVAAAVRAENIGYDGVDIHGGTAYLLQQFFSPHTNQRTDRYGGSLENRMRLPLEIVRGICDACGPNFPIGYVLVYDELLPDGIKREQAIAFAERLEQERVAYISMQCGTYETKLVEEGRGHSMRQKKGIFDVSEAFKKEVGIKVIPRSTGAHEPIMWEEAIQHGKCDAIFLGRPLLCDPELPRKVLQGQLDDIRPCIRCGYCYDRVVIPPTVQIACAVNPEVGRDREFAIQHIASQPKRVLVIGGGPAGLEAARVAALRGHEVALMEKKAEAGGNLAIASLPIGKEDMKNFIDWQVRQCRKAGVKIELNKEVTPEVVKEAKPDVVIIATGATPLIPPIPGATKLSVLTAEDVLSGRASLGKKVVVAGGGQVGAETADFIAEKDLAESVAIVEMLPAIAMDGGATSMACLLTMIHKYGVKVFTNMKIEEITDEGIIAIDKERNRHNIEADTVVLAMGYVSNRALYEALKGDVPELYIIGDCLKPRKLQDAVVEGVYIARQI